MKFQVAINVSINPYPEGLDQPSYSQSLYFNDKTDIEASNWTETGVKIDAIVGAIKSAMEARGDG